MKDIEYITNSYFNFNKCEYNVNCKYTLELIMKKNDYSIDFVIIFMMIQIFLIFFSKFSIKTYVINIILSNFIGCIKYYTLF